VALVPHRPERARLTHSVLHSTASRTSAVAMDDTCGGQRIARHQPQELLPSDVRPRCFSKAILYQGAPLPSTGSVASHVPRRHRYYQSTTTSCADYEVAYFLRVSAPTDPLPVRSHAAERTAGPGPVQARYRWLFFGWSNTGAPRFLENPSRIWRRTDRKPLGCTAVASVEHRRARVSPLPRSRIPASSSVLTLSAGRCDPHFADNEDTGFTDLSRLNHAASVPAAYASGRTLPHAHARLASGRWLAFTGWESNSLDSFERFPSTTSDFLLPQAYPGATAKVLQDFAR